MVRNRCKRRLRALAREVLADRTARGEPEFDVLLADMSLPDGHGSELMADLRKAGSATRGIALTGHGDIEDIEREYAAGFSTHLTKPVTFELLERSLQDAAAATPKVGAR